MSSVEDVLKKLKKKARPDQLGGMARYGMAVEKRLGVSIPELRLLAKEIGKNHELSLELWKTGIDEARILASFIDEPAKVTERQLEQWVSDFDSWDIVDQVSALVARTPYAVPKIHEWSERGEEFVKRTAFSLIAEISFYDKNVADSDFEQFFPIIKRAATDERNFVKKAVNWALRNIGKRNKALNQRAIEIAKEIQEIDSKSARWIAADAIKELESEAVQRRLKG